ncbi:MAG: SH3 domain-containing protein [Planctomycetes bacterium]|nr:SH3 domain-containing protein [Planctomycetota bacterium]
MLRSLAFSLSSHARGASAARSRLLSLAFATLLLAAGLGAQTPEELEAGRSPQEPTPAGQTPAPARPEVKPDDPAVKRVQAPAAESWARVKAGGATVRRYAGEREEAFRSLDAGTVVRVRGSYNGWWRVSVPGGLSGWVSTSFLKASDAPNERIVDADRVNFRVRPTMTDNAPLEPDRLERGERVLLLEQSGSWAHVQAPPRVSAWVDSIQLERLNDAGAAEQEFRKQQEQFLAAKIDEMEKAERERAYIASDAYAEELLKPVDQLRDQELAKSTSGNFQSVRDAYTALAANGVESKPKSPKLKEKVFERMKSFEVAVGRVEADALIASSQEMQDKIARESAQAKLEKEQEQLRAQAPTPDKVLENWQHFGWVVKQGEQTLSAGPVRYVIERGKLPSVNLMCESGRYDLSDYVGREIAVKGRERSEFTPPVFEVTQIRILTTKKRE